jgi:hypothetical protein
MNFITFGSHANYIDAGKRLLGQAKEFRTFNEITLFTLEDLKNDQDFWSKHCEFITQNTRRGYGYWVWKPYIIKKSMEKMNDGEILLYLDCGCEVHHSCENELLTFIDIVKKDKLVGTLASVERDWTKMDLVEKLKVNNAECLDSPQRATTAILFLVCEETKNFVNEWYDLICDYHNVDDSPSVLKNLECFQEHRHDQSIFSLLSKKYGLYSKENFTPFFPMRNRTGTSGLTYFY